MFQLFQIDPLSDPEEYLKKTPHIFSDIDIFFNVSLSVRKVSQVMVDSEGKNTG